MSVVPGLKGITAAETAISYIDGSNGTLIYRGYPILEIVQKGSFEKAAYLLWYGKWPSPEELVQIKDMLVSFRQLPQYIEELIQQLPRNMDMMSVIRTAVSAAGTDEWKWRPAVRQAVQLTSMIPSIIAVRSHHLCGTECPLPAPSMSHAEHYLYMLTGQKPKAAHTSALDTYMILTMEHGMNASTFSARVTASTESDMASAVTSAIGTMKGPLHGGAPSGVISLLDEVASCGDAESVILRRLNNGERLMGFGHRVYKTIDPRAAALKERLISLAGNDPWLDLAMETELTAVRILEAFKPGRSLCTNVEFYAAAIMKALNMSPELFTPTFTAARTAGWCAHILEQSEQNVLFRPQSEYTGPLHLKEPLT